MGAVGGDGGFPVEAEEGKKAYPLDPHCSSE